MSMGGNTMQRRLILGGLLAALVIGSFLPARADTGTLVGLGQVTAFSNCPNGLKVPIEGLNTQGNTWSFTIAAVHADCVITWGNPVTFQGFWNPLIGNMTNSVGAPCPVSIDLLRPGYFCLGPVPGQTTLHIANLKFCVSGRCYEGLAFVERA
jgi:hypothetical protein